MKKSVVLGSGSPRRLALLQGIGLEPHVVIPDVDESLHEGEGAQAYVRRLASAKLDAVIGKLAAAGVGTVVIPADTTVEAVDDSGISRILSKPADGDEARFMLSLLSDREHRVHTGFAVAVAGPGCRGVEWSGHVEVVTSKLRFRAMSPDEIDAYVASGEPFDKAGGYSIQGGAAHFVELIEGPLDSVVGLPLDRLIDVCAGLGQPI